MGPWTHPSIHPLICLSPLGENVKASPLENKSRNSDLQLGANSAEPDADKLTIINHHGESHFTQSCLLLGALRLVRQICFCESRAELLEG